MLLSGCLGGSLAQQVASSVATQSADQVVGNLVDDQLRREREPRQGKLANMEPDPFVTKFLLMQFPDPAPSAVIIEALPDEARQGNPPAAHQASRLLAVEVWSLVIGQEKQAVLDRSQQNGSTILPPPADWPQWQLAIGSLHGWSAFVEYLRQPAWISTGETGECKG